MSKPDLDPSQRRLLSPGPHAIEVKSTHGSREVASLPRRIVLLGSRLSGAVDDAVAIAAFIEANGIKGIGVEMLRNAAKIKQVFLNLSAEQLTQESLPPVLDLPACVVLYP